MLEIRDEPQATPNQGWDTPGEFPDVTGWLRALLHGHETVIRPLRQDAEKSANSATRARMISWSD